MKKFFTLLFAMTLAITASAVSFTYNWSQLIEGCNNQGASASAFIKTKSGNFIVSGKWGTTQSAGLNCYWNKEAIIDHESGVIEGFPYDNGNSYNSNVFISMVKATDGEPLWHIYTNVGDQSGSCTNIVELSDGTFVTFLTLRVSNNTTSQHLATITDAKGKSICIEHNTGDSKAVRVVLVKFNAEGEVLLTRTINGYDWNDASGTAVTTALNVKAIAADDADNIYLAGDSNTEFYVIGKNAKINCIAPEKQVATIVKFNKDGYYLASALFANDDSYKTSQADLIKIDGEKVYLFGKYAEAATGGFSNVPFFTTCDLDLNIGAIHGYIVGKNAKNGQNWLNYDIYQQGNNFYVCANVAGSISEGDVTVSFAEHNATTQAGIIIKIDNTGKLLAGQIIKTANSSLRGCTAYGDKILALGYIMTSGTKLYEFDANLSSVPEAVSLVNGGSVADALAPIVVGDDLFVATRSHKTNYSILGVDADQLIKPNTTYNFSLTIASWTMSSASGINSVNKDATGNDGKIYNLQGVQVSNTEAPGFYVVNGEKILK